MSIVLIFCILAAAGWLALSLLARPPKNHPGESVAAYSRAMDALDPTAQQPSRTVRRPGGSTHPRSATRRPLPERRVKGATAALPERRVKGATAALPERRVKGATAALPERRVKGATAALPERRVTGATAALPERRASGARRSANR